MVQNYQYNLMQTMSNDTDDSNILKIKPLSQVLVKSIEEMTNFDQAEIFLNFLNFYYGHIIKNQAYLNMKNGSKPAEIDLSSHLHKSPQFRTFYSVCEDNNITQFVRHFGLTP